jgi:FkbM family methyltransferase
MSVRAKLRRTTVALGTRLFQVLPGGFGDGRLRRSIVVRRRGEDIFRMRDLGPLTRMRAETFESKEPETLEWIEGFDIADSLLDVGANIGIYSLFAASRGCSVVAAEPDALNFAVLHENIRLNLGRLSGAIQAYPVAFHDSMSVSTLNVSSSEWGAALSAFGNTIDYKGDEFQPLFSQGCIGIAVDDFLEHVDFVPTHIKIDVDGNELFVIQGALRTIQANELRSVLVELDERRPDYSKCVELLVNSGLSLDKKLQSSVVSTSVFSHSFNHVFRRRSK